MKIINLFESKEYGWLNTASEHEQKTEIQRSPFTIQQIEYPSLNLQLLATDLDLITLLSIKHPSPKLFVKIKNKIILKILQCIKNENLYIAELYINYLDKHGVNWSELGVIKQSLRADGKITESIEDTIDTMPEDEQIKAINNYPSMFRFIKNPSELVQMTAVKLYPWLIQYIPNPSEEIQLIAVTKDGYAIEYIKNPSEAVQLAAVDQDACSIELIENPSEKVQLAAIEGNPLAFLRINKPTELVKKTLIAKRPGMIQYIDNQTEELQLLAISERPRVIHLIKSPFESVQLKAVKYNGANILSIEDFKILPSVFTECKDSIIKSLLLFLKDADKEAIKSYFHIFDMHNINWPELEIIKKSVKADNLFETFDINKMSEKDQILAVKMDSYYIKQIEDPSEAVQLAALKKNEEIFPYIKNPTESAQRYAIEQYSGLIQYIEHPSDEIIKLAIGKNISSIKIIKNKSSDFFDKFKPVILRKILKEMSKGLKIGDILNYLDLNNITWPELDIIKHSAKIDKLYESDDEDYNSMSEADQIDCVTNCPSIIKYIDTPLEAVQLAAVSEDGRAIEYIKRPSIAVQIAAVKNYPSAIQYIKNPSEKVQLAAIEHYGSIIQYIPNATEKVKLKSVMDDPDNIDYIENPSSEIQLAAVERKPRIILKLRNASEELKIFAVKMKPELIEHIYKPSENLQIAAMNADGNEVNYIDNVTINAINASKDSIIKSMLIMVKREQWSSADITLDTLKRRNIDWPEIKIIEASIIHDRSIRKRR